MTDAITREEKLMEAIANGSVSNIKPITRQEMFLAKAGGQDVETPEPITRREKLLQAIIDNGGGGSGDTGGGTETLDALIDGSITELTSNVTEIRNSAFMSLSTLKSVDFPLATTIRQYGFKNCTALEDVNIPLVSEIESNGFDGCAALKQITVPLITLVNSGVFSGCRSLIIADFSLVTRLNSGAFKNAYLLKAVLLRNTTVCQLASALAFDGCHHLSGTVNSLYNPNGDKDGYIYVPRDLVDSYKTATNWSTYASQFRALEDYTVDGTITGELDESKI